MMKSDAYWQKRFSQLEDSLHKSSVSKYAEIQQQFDIAERKMAKEIDAWYGRFATENGVSISDARKMLNAKEMAELKWDVNQYIKYGKENELNQKWMHELENASARVHINRLEAIKLRIQAESEKLYGNLTDEISDHIAKQYGESYYHTGYEIAKGAGIGVNYAAINERKLEALINKPWAADGKNFATRLGENKANLIDNVYKSLVQMTLTGENPDKAISMLAKTMNGDKYRAGRIIMTESAYFTELANKESYKELGVKQYEIIATLDSHTSEICQEMDGKVFDMSVFEPGLTAPPFHPNCRSTTAPYFEDDYDLIGERAARDENGNTYYVPADTTFKDWYKGFVGDKANPEKAGFMPMDLQLFAKPLVTNMPSVSDNPTFGCHDILDEMVQKSRPGKGNIVEIKDFIQGKGRYIVGEPGVRLNIGKEEKRIAHLWKDTFGGNVKLMPEVAGPHKNVSVPDLIIDGKRYDLKTPRKNNPNTFYNAIHVKNKQADNFIVDISKNGMTQEEAIEQIEGIFRRPHTAFVNSIVLVKDDKILKVFVRN